MPLLDILLLFSLIVIALACGGGGGSSSGESIDNKEEDNDYSPSSLVGQRLAGNASIKNSTNDAFNRSFPGISGLDIGKFEAGDFVFDRSWIIAKDIGDDPKDGLGPLFNAVSCSSCHVRDGRSFPRPEVSGAMSGLLLKLSVPGSDEKGRPKGDPNYGGQFNDRAIDGVLPEGSFTISHEDITGSYPDGSTYTLQKPIYTFTTTNYGPLSPELMVSSRVAPGAYGIGILDHIPERDILALEDPMDADGDGISGRANWVWDEEEKKLSLGRMGWKAGKVNVRQQSAGAFNGDVGVTSTFFPSHDHGLGQEDLNAYPDGREAGESVELKEDELDKAVFYLNRLAVPYRRNTDQPDVMAGAKLFDQLNCSGCHTPSFEMDDSGPVEDYHRQTIHPFTDLLLHDMGEALSDHRPVFGASGNEWRTPPLWGIGLVEKVNGHTRFLHDGRARDLEEAVLWHGGEAQASQTAFKSLSADKRQQLIQFLESL